MVGMGLKPFSSVPKLLIFVVTTVVLLVLAFYAIIQIEEKETSERTALGISGKY